jgi:hypothetical protein
LSIISEQRRKVKIKKEEDEEARVGKNIYE